MRDTFVLLIWQWTMRPTMCRSTGFAHVGILTSFREDARIQFKPFLPPFVPRIVASTIIARRWQMKRAGERFSCTVMREWRCCAWGKSGEVVNDLRMGWVEEKKMKRNWLFGLQEEKERDKEHEGRRYWKKSQDTFLKKEKADWREISLLRKIRKVERLFESTGKPCYSLT